MTGKLWNLVRYVHPHLSGDSTAWDAALVEAIPKIEASHSDEEMALPLDAMLKTLNDPSTRIVHGMSGKSPSTQALDTDTMVIRAGDGDLSESFGTSLLLRSGLTHPKTIIWDLRGSRMLPGQPRPTVPQLAESGLGFAYRQHTGYPGEGSPGAGYYSALQIVEPQRNAPNRAAGSVKQIYLIDKDSAVPPQAILEQFANRTAIISEDPPRTGQAGFTELVPVYGSITAEVRVAEYRYPDGTTEFAPNRVVLNRGADAVNAAAKSVDAGESFIPAGRPPFQIFSAGFRDVGDSEPYPSRERRILAAIRTWGIFHYFDPDVTSMGSQWDDVFIELIPKIADAHNAAEFNQAIAAMVARTRDPLATVASDELAKFYGQAAPPFEVRFIENQPVVTQVFNSAQSCPAKPGDIILAIDGAPIAGRIAELTAHLAGPNQTVVMARVASLLLNRPAEGSIHLKVRRADGTEPDLSVSVNRRNLDYQVSHRTGDVVRLINDKLGYVDLERIATNGIDEMFAKLANTSAIIFDLRGYARNVVGSYSIAPHLAASERPVAAKFFKNIVGIGLEAQDHITVQQTDARVPRDTNPHYKGKTIALVDDSAVGHSEDCAMFLKAANKSVIIGSRPAGGFAGITSQFDLPGGLHVFFSGESPHWPDGRSLYPAGLQPDIVVTPTLAAIRAGKDEILDRAIAYAATQN
jgi:C-terminal processing protease CtpA/Prc